MVEVIGRAKKISHFPTTATSTKQQVLEDREINAA
jgi:hypothetical protein